MGRPTAGCQRRPHWTRSAARTGGTDAGSGRQTRTRAAPAGGIAGRRGGEVEPGEGEGLGEVRLPLGTTLRPSGVDLDDDEAIEAPHGEHLQQLGTGLGTPPRYLSLIHISAQAVG